MSVTGSGSEFAYRKVVDQIDTLTSDLQLEDEMTDSSKTDTLNSSSSGTTASSIEKIKVQANAPLIKPPAHPSAILTVLRKPNPPPPPPRLTPVKCEDPQRVVPTVNPIEMYYFHGDNGIFGAIEWYGNHCMLDRSPKQRCKGCISRILSVRNGNMLVNVISMAQATLTMTDFGMS
ncbi:hypothetical protein EI555_010201 [Monodon monoceros]|uniref:Uncharacterized protein n=1 Tax=Monodon monoceros TaxID=40151 RepID=A0A4U1FEP4_MONMO|nr:hypothetical protein EI555_010201 [Monodon monoceros]